VWRILCTFHFHINLLILIVEPKISWHLLRAVIHFNLGHMPTMCSSNVWPVMTPISSKLFQMAIFQEGIPHTYCMRLFFPNSKLHAQPSAVPTYLPTTHRYSLIKLLVTRIDFMWGLRFPWLWLKVTGSAVFQRRHAQPSAVPTYLPTTRRYSLIKLLVTRIDFMWGLRFPWLWLWRLLVPQYSKGAMRSLPQYLPTYLPTYHSALQLD
jgi:hypothetical protein